MFWSNMCGGIEERTLNKSHCVFEKVTNKVGLISWTSSNTSSLANVYNQFKS